jgi:hypothetical protein
MHARLRRHFIFVCVLLWIYNWIVNLCACSSYIGPDGDTAVSGGGVQLQVHDGYSSAPDAAGSNFSAGAEREGSRPCNMVTVMERRRRRRLNDRLYALRSVVPNITKVSIGIACMLTESSHACMMHTTCIRPSIDAPVRAWNG